MKDRFDIDQVIKITGLGIQAEQADGGADFDAACQIAVKKLWKIKEYESLEEQGKLLKLPCAVGDFALFSDGDIRPVVYVTMSNAHEGIIVGCQNGINISMNLQYGSWCKGFFKTKEEAEAALKEFERG